MIRILFWILVAVGLGTFFFVSSRQKTMTADENALFFGSIITGIFFVVACLLIFYSCWALKRRVIIAFGRIRGKVFLRDSQPFGYWSTVLFYFVLAISFLTGAYIRGRDLLPLLLK
jgi:hypothetical protein